MVCFVINLLRWVVVSYTIRFFVGFRVDGSNEKVQFDKIIISNFVDRYVTDLEF